MPEDTPLTGKPDPADTLDWDAVARYLAGESSAEESARIRSALAARPQDEALVHTLDRIVARMPESIPADLDVEAALARVKSRRKATLQSITTAPSRVSKWQAARPLLAAAAAVLIMVTGWFILRDESSVAPVISTPRGYATGIGSLDSIRLADGSLMVLGPASFASIAADFNQAERRVDIRGDAYFEVVHKESSPFVVHAGPAIVRDIGTRFAVHSDTAEGVTVAVAEGTVTLSANDAAAPQLLLQGGQRGVVRPDRPPQRLHGNVNEDLAWMRGQLVFRESPMSEVVSSLRRWYGINLRFEDRSFASRHFTGTFSGEPPERVVDVIRLALGARIERRGDTVVIRSPDKTGGPGSR